MYSKPSLESLKKTQVKTPGNQYQNSRMPSLPDDYHISAAVFFTISWANLRKNECKDIF